MYKPWGGTIEVPPKVMKTLKQKKLLSLYKINSMNHAKLAPFMMRIENLKPFCQATGLNGQ